MAQKNRYERAEAAAPHETQQPPESVGAAFPIVGIGASAGGLEAFSELLAALPRKTGMAYVLVLHLPPQHTSLLPEILGRTTKLPLSELRDAMMLEPDHVYVLPAGADAELADGTVRLVQRDATAGHHYPIDRFFRSLAEHYGEKAIGVVLSGTASDGTRGVQEIKAAGGITFAQDDTAQHGSMPHTAIATGAIDFVLRPSDIARELARLATHPFIAAPQETAVPDLTPVLAILRGARGADLTLYKQNTLYRRIARRVLLHKLDGFDEYVRLLESSPGEVEALYQDVLISVTSFFRDPQAFEALKAEVFPALTNNRSRHDPVRIWTLACSTGEEAYSLAMAFAEYTEDAGHALPLQVFGTDINHVSVERARLGFYPKSAVTELSTERLRRFFVEADGGYRIAKSIRDACVFARHNVLDDPPFSRIDLVSCRNMLIYLGPELQQKVIPVLHYALQPAGYLWLGNAETIGSFGDLFELRNTRYKIYAKKPAAAPVSALITPAAPRGTPPAGLAEYMPPGEPRPVDAQREVERLLVSRYAPAGVVIRSNLEIVQYRGNTAPYLTPAPGRATLNLLKMLREGLALAVRSAVQRAKAEETAVRQEGITVGTDGGERKVNVEVIPVKTGMHQPDLFMVLFDDVPQHARAVPRTAEAELTDEAQQQIAQLKQELAATREYLQSVIEQQEAANEELQSANEEVQSANEELQSINEELETSKEEVQSSNEELATVNDELQTRNNELAQSNNDLVNLISSVQMPIVMLGANLRIRRFTPSAEQLLNLIPADIGRPVSDVKLNLDVPDLEKLVADAIDTTSVREREVQDRQGRWYLTRVQPYRTLENKIDGAVVVLVDVDSLKRSQEMLRQQTELLNQAHEPIVMWELDGGVTYWNKAAEEMYGFTREQALGRRIHELLLATPPYEAYREALVGDGHWTGEITHTSRRAQKIVVESRIVAVTDTAGRKLVVQADRPITERKESERVLRNLADSLVTADRNKDEFLAILAHELRNPLGPLRNVVSVLSSDADAVMKSRALEIMERQVVSMSRLVEDLLDISRITVSKLELRKSAVDLGAVVRRVVEDNEPIARERLQRVQAQLPNEPVILDADGVRLEQIVRNLLNNASKYTDDGGRITISVERAGESALLRVKDNGVGIDSDKLPHVFEPFVRAAGASHDRHGGLGIGLTLVRRLVELHGGEVEAHSEGLGRGSEFVVRLPLGTAAGNPAA